jgi:hypothetical protein
VHAYNLGQWDAAAAAFEDALDFAPLNADLYFNRGATRLAAGQYGSAIADFNRALRLAPGHAGAAFDRGLARARLGDLAGARYDWEYARAVEPRAEMRDWMTTVSLIESAAAEARAAALASPRPAATGAATPAGGDASTGVVVTPDRGPVPVAPGPSVAPEPVAPSRAQGATPAPGAPSPQGAAPPASQGTAAPGPQGTAPSGPQAVAAPAGTAAPGTASPQPAELAGRGVQRALQGDRAGALADLRAAQGAEADPAARARIGSVAAAATAPTDSEFEACNRQAAGAVQSPPAAGASAPGGAPARSRPIAALAGGPGVTPPFAAQGLLERADPGMRGNPAFRRAFLDCLRRLGF